jgi:hypothetical protein
MMDQNVPARLAPHEPIKCIDAQRKISRRRWLVIGTLVVAALVPVALRLAKFLGRRPKPLELVLDGPFNPRRIIPLTGTRGDPVLPTTAIVSVGTAKKKRRKSGSMSAGVMVYFKFPGDENLHRAAIVTAFFLDDQGDELARALTWCVEADHVSHKIKVGSVHARTMAANFARMNTPVSPETAGRIARVRLCFEDVDASFTLPQEVSARKQRTGEWK